MRIVSALLAAMVAVAPVTVQAAPASAGADEALAPAAEPPEDAATPTEGDGTDPAADPEADPNADPGTEPTEPVEPPPRDENLDKAEKQFLEANDDFETGHYAEAIPKFEGAYELLRDVPGMDKVRVDLLFNLGQAYWKWFDVDPDIDHLRKAAQTFRNYDKRKRLDPDYSPAEVDNILKAIDAQIENEERKAAERNRPVVVAPSGPTEDELRREQRRRTTRGLNASGTALIVVGSLAAGLGLAGLITRGAYKVILDNQTSSTGVTLATADEDARRRNGFLLGGQIAFAGLITAAIILPAGIALRVTGATRDKKDREHARGQDAEREKLKQYEQRGNKKVALEPRLGGFAVRF
jgi:tetratricopeptide (TPR) repeat protein